MQRSPRTSRNERERSLPDRLNGGGGWPALCRTVLVLGILLAAFCSCGPPATAPASDDDATDDDALLETIERRVGESIERVRRSAVTLEYVAADAPSGTRRVATGVVVNDLGDVLSIRVDSPPVNAPIMARDASGHRHRTRWVAADLETGLTLLQIAAHAAPAVQAARRRPRLGSQVLVIGNPFGLGHSVIRGQVAGLDRRVDVGPRPLGGLIQIDAALHPGDSGALLANLKGEWLGLIRSGLAVPGSEGRTLDHDLGFAIPARDALWIADQLRTHHRVERAYLGVRLNIGSIGESSGAVLDGVLSGSPAARAGLKPGDRVVAFDGHPIESAGDLTDRLDRTSANAEATLEYFRGTRRDRLTVRTGSRPPLESSSSSVSSQGTSAKAEDAHAVSPRELLERIERLERRVRELEKAPPSSSRP